MGSPSAALSFAVWVGFAARVREGDDESQLSQPLIASTEAPAAVVSPLDRGREPQVGVCVAGAEAVELHGLGLGKAGPTRKVLFTESRSASAAMSSEHARATIVSPSMASSVPS